MDDDYERILLIKQECLVYKLPPRTSIRGYRAADWGLDKPQWTGRMRIITKNNKVEIKLEDKTSGQLFAAAPVAEFPGVAVEPVTDSSRYFVLRIADGSGRTAFIGAGFADRGDAFDFNVALQDHFNREKSVNEMLPEQPKLDLGLKAGQTISIKLGNNQAKARSKPKTGGGGGGMLLLPPPPTASQPQKPVVAAPAAAADTEWGQFASSSSSSTAKDWVKF